MTNNRTCPFFRSLPHFCRYYTITGTFSPCSVFFSYLKFSAYDKLNVPVRSVMSPHIHTCCRPGVIHARSMPCRAQPGIQVNSKYDESLCLHGTLHFVFLLALGSVVITRRHYPISYFFVHNK